LFAADGQKKDLELEVVLSLFIPGVLSSLRLRWHRQSFGLSVESKRRMVKNSESGCTVTMKGVRVPSPVVFEGGPLRRRAM